MHTRWRFHAEAFAGNGHGKDMEKKSIKNQEEHHIYSTMMRPGGKAVGKGGKIGELH